MWKNIWFYNQKRENQGNSEFLDIGIIKKINIYVKLLNESNF